MHIASLYRYPVKGFPAEAVDSAIARPGTGFDGDRAVAFSNGSSPVAQDAWSHCDNFTALKNDTSLQSWQVHYEADPAPGGQTTPLQQAQRITLTSPKGEQVSFSPTDHHSLKSAGDFLAARLHPQSQVPRQLVAAEQGMFDSQFSGLSFINLATVAALSQASPQPVDPLRFRGNVHLTGLAPGQEFSLIGATVRIGDVICLIRSSIERCSATRVNPRTAQTDLAVPSLLASICGHLKCGVYGVVLVPGRISTGDHLEVLAPAGQVTTVDSHEFPPPAARELIKQETGPRFMTITNRHEHPDGTVELQLRDDLGWFASRFVPGQHVRIHGYLAGAPVWRTYTVTHADRHQLGIAIKPRGPVSQSFAAHGVSEQLLVSGPFGTISAATLTAAHQLPGTADPEPASAPTTQTSPPPVTSSPAPAVALISAGVGITSTLSVLPGLATEQLSSLTLVHLERGQQPSDLWQRAQELGHRVANRLSAHRWNTRNGRPGEHDLRQLLAGSDVVLTCGPPDFTSLVHTAALATGVPAERIHREVFASPGSSQAAAISSFAPATIHTDSNTIAWTPASGTILDALEAAGATIPTTCRGGSCGDCVLRLTAGQIAYPVAPIAATEPGEFLSCSAVPDGDITVTLPS